MGEARHRRRRPEGRHARRYGEFTDDLNFLFRRTNRRYTIVALLSVVAAVGLLALAVGVTVAQVGTESARGRGQERPANSRVTSAATSPKLASAPAGGDALNFLRHQVPQEARHAKEVRWSGDFLRVYTDLPEEDDNARAAVALCQATTSYLTDQLGRARPIVFVHAKQSDNGHVVLANKLNAHDSCQVGVGR